MGAFGDDKRLCLSAAKDSKTSRWFSVAAEENDGQMMRDQDQEVDAVRIIFMEIIHLLE